MQSLQTTVITQRFAGVNHASKQVAGREAPQQKNQAESEDWKGREETEKREEVG
jgi:hypothetical protein